MSTSGFSRPRDAARAFTPALAAFVDAPLYDKVWADATLSPRERSLITVSALVALGRRAELPSHLRRAIDNGVGKAELSAAITHLAFYAGFPAAIEASVIAAETLGPIEIPQTPPTGSHVRSQMSDTILSDKILSSSAFSHTIDVPIEKVDIADWLFKLPEAEYQRCCPPDHISCATTSTDAGRPMSINVEMIGQTLMIQHYVAEIAKPDLCRMVSTSDAFTANGRTRVQVIWTLSAKRIDDGSCEYTNSVLVHPTQEFMDFIGKHEMSFEQAAAARQRDGGDHNRRETPLFAESIARKAKARI